LPQTLDQIVSRKKPVKAKAVADIRERLLAENRSIKDRAAACSRRYRARKTEVRLVSDTRSCSVCDKPLKGQRSDARFCSTKCRMKAHRDQLRAVSGIM